MKITVVDNNIETVEAKLQSISQYTTNKRGIETIIVVLHTDKGNFSNFKQVWRRQHIDADSLNEGDMLTIDYTIHTAANGVQFKNFVKVKCSTLDDKW